jgi:hypothetical protein
MQINEFQNEAVVFVGDYKDAVHGYLHRLGLKAAARY